MPDAGIRIENLNKTIRSLEEMGVSVQDLKAAFQKISDEGASQASRFVPRASGRLMNSIKGSKSKNKAVIRAGGARAKYAGVQEFGWPRRHVSASKFLHKAESAVLPTVVPTLERELQALINDLGLNDA